MFIRQVFCGFEYFSNSRLNWKSFEINKYYEKNLFEKYYKVLGHIIISKNLGINEHYLEILNLDLFVKNTKHVEP